MATINMRIAAERLQDLRSTVEAILDEIEDGNTGPEECVGYAFSVQGRLEGTRNERAVLYSIPSGKAPVIDPGDEAPFLDGREPGERGSARFTKLLDRGKLAC